MRILKNLKLLVPFLRSTGKFIFIAPLFKYETILPTTTTSPEIILHPKAHIYVCIPILCYSYIVVDDVVVVVVHIRI